MFIGIVEELGGKKKEKHGRRRRNVILKNPIEHTRSRLVLSVLWQKVKAAAAAAL